MCQKRYLWQISKFLNKALTVFLHIYKIWHISDQFPNLFWSSSDRYLHLTVFWHISDLISDIFMQLSFLTDFWQVSDCFLLLLGPTLMTSTKLCLQQSLMRDKEVLFCYISHAEWPRAGRRRVLRRRARWPVTTWAGGRTCLSRRVELRRRREQNIPTLNCAM